jgi:hypothetical protein
MLRSHCRYQPAQGWPRGDELLRCRTAWDRADAHLAAGSIELGGAASCMQTLVLLAAGMGGCAGSDSTACIC